MLSANEILSARDSYQEMQNLSEHRKVCSSRASKTKPMHWKSEKSTSPSFDIVKSRESEYIKIKENLVRGIEGILRIGDFGDELQAKTERFKELAEMFIEEVSKFEENVLAGTLETGAD